VALSPVGWTVEETRRERVIIRDARANEADCPHRQQDKAGNQAAGNEKRCEQ
jgi:hypothetical protein